MSIRNRPGGKFDGNYGVLAGFEVLRTLNDAGIVTEKPIAVAIWTNEEGSRFVPVMGGSGAFAGVFTLEHLAQLSATSTGSRSAMRSAASGMRAAHRLADARSMRISRRTSSRDRSSSARTGSSAW